MKDELFDLGDDEMLIDEVVEQVLQRLNKRATAASQWKPPGGWPVVDPTGSDPDGAAALLALISGSRFDPKCESCE